MTKQSVKVGRRNSKADMDRIQRVHDLMVELGAQCEMEDEEYDDDMMESEDAEPSLEQLIADALGVKQELYGGIERAELTDEDFVIPEERAFPVMTRGDVQDAVSSWGRYRGPVTFEQFKLRLTELARRKGLEDALPVSWQMAKSAGTVKALGHGKIGGYLVLFSDDKSPDLAGDFFAKSTQFGVDQGDALPVYYQHGMDRTIGKRRLGKAMVTKIDDAGVWIEAQLMMRDEYESAIYDMVQKGKLGWSSGAASHLVERQNVGKSAMITYWQLAEASLTPTPAEPRTSAVITKSLPPETTPEAQQRGDVVVIVNPILRVTE